jgi:diguanylate cyclase (GGDEF)-like protein
MKLRYLSLSWKMLLLMLSMLLLLLFGFTSLSLLHMNEQFQRQQTQRKAQGQQYFTFYNQAIEQQLLTWLQSYAELQQLDQATDFREFAFQLLQQTELLQLHFAVTQLSLYDPDQQLLLQSGGAMPQRASTVLQRTLTQQRPQSLIHCDSSCYKLLSLPLLNGNGDVAVLLLSAELTDVLFSLHQTLGVDVAVLNYQAMLDSGLDTGLLQASDRELVQRIYQHLMQQDDIAALHRQGAQVQIEQQQYYLHRITLDVLRQDDYVLLMLEDISKVLQENRRYQQKVLWLAGACFIAMALLILLLSRRISQRILHLANTLPLLAQRRYSEFRRFSTEPADLVADELSLFNEAVHTLSDDLEKLDTQLAEKTASLERMAMFDQLTGLGNRNLLQYQLQLALAALEQQSAGVALLFLDLDKFKNINNSRSHAVGDVLLKETAARLQQLVTPAQVLCRFGGDEFAIVLPQLHNANEAEQLAAQVLALFNRPFSLAHGSVTLTASIGVSISFDASTSAEELIRQADLAMYQAKNNGRNCVYRFNQQMSADLASRLQLEHELKQAIAQQQFFLAYQPQVNLTSGRLSGFEALLRWQHPQRGVVAPDEFISVLEQTQLIVEVGYWVFERSCQQCKALVAQGLDDIVIAVNVSAAQFLQTDLPEQFSQILRRYGVDANHFELELTESTLVSQVSQTLDIMYQLKAMGFRFAIDDFGTGYSSLNYLKRMPVDTIKIDKGFVQSMLDNTSDHQIVVSTIAMVQKLGLQVVAEGVESLAHLQLLQQHHCDFAQGFYLARPIAESQLAAFVSTQVQQQSWPAQLLR